MKLPFAITLGVAAALATGACTNRPEVSGAQRCEWPDPVVASAQVTVPAHRFAGIDTTWTLARVFARLGPARREAGDFTYEWVADDGRVFVATAANRCGLVRRADFVEARPGS
jgi:hypothetical protein